tara:strand:- start:174 stop:959 length:786 start_codon:yes stop_codon:yes gene_type:complete
MGIKYLNIESNQNIDHKENSSGLGLIFPKKNEIESKNDNSDFFDKEVLSENFSNKINSHIHELNENEIKSKKETFDKNKKDLLFNLNQKYSSCLKCELGKTRTNFVFGVGSYKSKIMFIGEGPGADEDQTGEPFVGRAGKLLTKMINSIGIERQDAYITNIVKCRPPQNRNPLDDEIASCFPILKQQIEIVNPKLIVTLGNFPAKSLIPDIQGITKIHGKIFQYENWQMLPTFHPSYLLRNRSSMSMAWHDFKKITELALR